jgi:hypothetical protein
MHRATIIANVAEATNLFDMTIPIKFFKMSLNFDVNSNLSLIRRFHAMEKL